jgi:hypothetical protein
MHRLLTGLLLALAAAPSLAQTKKEPVTLRDFGSFHIGGRREARERVPQPRRDQGSCRSWLSLQPYAVATPAIFRGATGRGIWSQSAEISADMSASAASA